MSKIYLGLGSNQGNRVAALTDAIKKLGEKMRIFRSSSIYESEPVWASQRSKNTQPWFLNMAIAGESEISPEEVMFFAKAIEKEAGRNIKDPDASNKPRPLDIDILLYGNHVTQTDELQIPHARMLARRFVLLPLVEIAPDAIHPIAKKTTAELLKECPDRSIVRLYGTK